MNEYQLGVPVRLRAAFTNLAGAPVNPGTVTFKVKSPLGITTTYVYLVDAEVVKDSDGNYHVDHKPNRQGVWSYASEGAGVNETAGESSFKVLESQFD
jgi:hypothetical protein